MSTPTTPTEQRSDLWVNPTNKLTTVLRFTKSTTDESDDEKKYAPDRVGSKFRSLNLQNLHTEEDEFYQTAELPPDFQIRPVYEEIMEEPLPPMDIFPAYKAEEGQLETVIAKMDSRLRRTHTYKAFIEETREMLTYVLQEVKLRKAVQSQLQQRENEMHSFIEFYKRDPRICKVLMLADHWRASNDESEEKIKTLVMEAQTLTSDFKMLESKLVTMQKRQEKLEAQLAKCRICEGEKDMLEEKIVMREKIALHLNDQVEQLEGTVAEMQTQAAAKEEQFHAKLEAAPDRHATKVAALTRELEVMSLEKEFKTQEVRDLQMQVKMLFVENSRTADRVKLLRSSVKQLKTLLRTVDARHQSVVCKNKGLTRQIEYNAVLRKANELDILTLTVENTQLRKTIEELTTEIHKETIRHTSALRSISKQQAEIKELRRQLLQQKVVGRELEKNLGVLGKTSRKNEIQASNAARVHLKDIQMVKEMQKKMTTASRHIRTAVFNVNRMGEVLDRNAERLRLLDLDLSHCQNDNKKNNTTITHLYNVLDATENLIRLQLKENDALVISKNKMVNILRTCCNSKNKLQNEVSRLHTVKTAMEDSALIHQYMLEFVQSERDGALRNQKVTDEAVVLMQRKQVARIAQIARANEESSGLKIRLEELQKQLTVQKREFNNLSMSLKAAESIISCMDDAYRALLVQRDLFGRRILMQNNEAAVVKIKLENMSSTMDIGQTMYRDRCNDIKVLKKEIQNLRRKVKALENTDSQCHELRTEVCHLSKELSLEMNKRAAIERCKMPKVHHNRDVQSSNPSMYDMILRIQRLQKHLIRKTQDCIAKEKEITIRNDTIQTLQKALKRREQAKSPKKVNKTLVRKDNQIKALMGELNMLQFYLDAQHKLTSEQREELVTARQEITKLRSASLSSSNTRKSSQFSGSLGSKLTATRHPPDMMFQLGRPSSSSPPLPTYRSVTAKSDS